jgi:hypothetical protein
MATATELQIGAAGAQGSTSLFNDTYAHLLEEMDDDAAELAAGAIRGRAARDRAEPVRPAPFGCTTWLHGREIGGRLQVTDGQSGG